MSEFRVLHIIKGLGRGGAEKLLVETIAMHSSNFRFDVVYFLPHKNHLVKELEQLGCHVYLLPASGALSMLWKIHALLKIIRSNKYHVIHCHLPWAGILGRIAARFTRTPVVYTEHNNFSTYHPATRFAHKVGFSWFDSVIAVSADARAALQKESIKIKNLITILNGVNTTKFNRELYNVQELRKSFSLDDKDFVVATVAVFRKQKRLDRWLALAKEIVEADSRFRFLIIGDGPLNDELRALAKELKLEEYVIFTGLLEDPRPYLASSNMYLMSSDFEGLPVAMLEAMSMQCVPVVTPVGGIPDVITDGKNGILYAADEIKNAKSRIIELKNSKEMQKTYSEAARNKIMADYSVTRMVQQLEEVYYSVSKTKGKVV